MGKFCTKCPRRYSCQSLCQELSTYLEEEFPVQEQLFHREIPISQVKVNVKIKQDDIGDQEKMPKEELLSIFLFNKIRSDVSDEESELLKGMENPIFGLSDLTENDYLKMDKYIDRIKNVKQRRILISYLKCASITDIGRRTNTTKQNIQKHLKRGFMKLFKIMNPEKKDGILFRTPREIKGFYSGSKF